MAWFDIYQRQGQKWVFRKRIIKKQSINLMDLKKILSSELAHQPGELVSPEDIKIVQPVELKEDK